MLGNLFDYWLDILQKISIIIAAGSALFALLEYRYRRKQDKALALVEQIAFFREKVIVKGDELVLLVKEIRKEPNYKFTRIPLDDPKISSIRDKYPDQVNKQLELMGETRIFAHQVSLLNMMEELSLRVIYSGTSGHPALKALKPSFIEMAEVCTLVLISQREIITGNESYSATLDLYSNWKDEVDRSSPEERLSRQTKV